MLHCQTVIIMNIVFKLWSYHSPLDHNYYHHSNIDHHQFECSYTKKAQLFSKDPLSCSINKFIQNIPLYCAGQSNCWWNYIETLLNNVIHLSIAIFIRLIFMLSFSAFAFAKIRRSNWVSERSIIMVNVSTFYTNLMK